MDIKKQIKLIEKKQTDNKLRKCKRIRPKKQTKKQNRSTTNASEFKKNTALLQQIYWKTFENTVD